MPTKAFKVVIEMDIQAVTCPGVILSQTGSVFLKMYMLEYTAKTMPLPPNFPLLYHQKFVFEKIFTSCCNLAELQEYMQALTVFIELVQWSDYGMEIVLAMFESSVFDLLYPSNDQRGIMANIEVDLLMEATFDFPGILSPKIETATRTVIEEIVNPVVDVAAGHKPDFNPKVIVSKSPYRLKRNMVDIRQKIAEAQKRPACPCNKPRSVGMTRHWRERRPPFVVRHVDDNNLYKPSPTIRRRPFLSRSTSSFDMFGTPFLSSTTGKVYRPHSYNELIASCPEHCTKKTRNVSPDRYGAYAAEDYTGTPCSVCHLYRSYFGKDYKEHEKCHHLPSKIPHKSVCVCESGIPTTPGTFFNEASRPKSAPAGTSSCTCSETFNRFPVKEAKSAMKGSGSKSPVRKKSPVRSKQKKGSKKKIVTKSPPVKKKPKDLANKVQSKGRPDDKSKIERCCPKCGCTPCGCVKVSKTSKQFEVSPVAKRKDSNLRKQPTGSTFEYPSRPDDKSKIERCCPKCACTPCGCVEVSKTSKQFEVSPEPKRKDFNLRKQPTGSTSEYPRQRNIKPMKQAESSKGVKKPKISVASKRLKETMSVKVPKQATAFQSSKQSAASTGAKESARQKSFKESDRSKSPKQVRFRGSTQSVKQNSTKDSNRSKNPKEVRSKGSKQSVKQKSSKESNHSKSSRSAKQIKDTGNTLSIKIKHCCENCDCKPCGCVSALQDESAEKGRPAPAEYICLHCGCIPCTCPAAGTPVVHQESRRLLRSRQSDRCCDNCNCLNCLCVQRGARVMQSVRCCQSCGCFPCICANKDYQRGLQCERCCKACGCTPCTCANKDYQRGLQCERCCKACGCTPCTCVRKMPNMTRNVEIQIPEMEEDSELTRRESNARETVRKHTRLSPDSVRTKHQSRERRTSNRQQERTIGYSDDEKNISLENPKCNCSFPCEEVTKSSRNGTVQATAGTSRNPRYRNQEQDIDFPEHDTDYEHSSVDINHLAQRKSKCPCSSCPCEVQSRNLGKDTTTKITVTGLQPRCSEKSYRQQFYESLQKSYKDLQDKAKNRAKVQIK